MPFDPSPLMKSRCGGPSELAIVPNPRNLFSGRGGCHCVLDTTTTERRGPHAEACRGFTADTWQSPAKAAKGVPAE